jgi:hypothetical protein
MSAIYAQTGSSRESTRSLYIEIGGPSIIYTFNYDFSFDSTDVGGFGLRTGLGASAVDDFYLVTVPVMVQYLLGNKKNYFEMAAGPVVNFGSDEIIYIDPGATPVIGSLYFGYRHQPSDMGFLFRVGMPIFIGFNEYYDYDGFLYTSILPGVFVRVLLLIKNPAVYLQPDPEFLKTQIVIRWNAIRPHFLPCRS